MPKLAINGGKKIRNRMFPRQKTPYEWIMSGHRGSWGPNFWGGKCIQELELAFANQFSCRSKALAVNSCTSALQIACGAIGLKPGDEVIVTPWSMSCSATAPMIYGAVPVFADIEPDYFCLDPNSIENKITEKTKAIIVVDLFGQMYDVEKINDIAKRHNLFIIEDAAQAVGAESKMYRSGEAGHIGCFSFTQGKHLTAGEGGMIMTDNEELYMKCALLRNHAEAVVNGMPAELGKDYKNLVGFNMRMTELQAQILIDQVNNIDSYLEYRKQNAKKLYFDIGDIDGIIPAKVRERNIHTYYCQAFHYDPSMNGVHRDEFIKAVKAELMEEEGRIDRGVPVNAGYINPLYKFPIFEDRKIERLSVVERLQNDELFITLYPGLQLDEYDIKDIADAFYKVAENVNEIYVCGGSNCL